MYIEKYQMYLLLSLKQETCAPKTMLSYIDGAVALLDCISLFPYV
jgi:hypothetical protein